MKKLTLALGVFTSTFFAANAQCTIDPDSIPTGQMAYPTELPCAEQGVPYDQTVQFKVPGSVDLQDFGSPFPFVLTVDSLVIDSVSGLPAGFTATYNPTSGVFPGGSNGCFNVAGTTNDPVGSYPVSVYGTISMHGNPFPPYFDGDTTVSLEQMQQAGYSPFDFVIDVIEQGAECRPDTTGTGIATLNSFNAIIKTYPNPTSNMLNLDINTVSRINGTVTIFDALGRTVFAEKVDYLGLVKKQINVAAFGRGIYSLQISDAKHTYKTKFIVE